jgi:hypothetical protein
MFKKKKISLLILVGLLILPSIVCGVGNFQEYGDQYSIFGILESVIYTVWMIFAALGVIMIVIAGILFLTASGDPAKLTTARSAFIWGAIGIAIGIIAFSITAIISGQLQ